MTRLDGAFRRPQLVGYLVGGHPDETTFLENASALIENGCGVLEVGIPFSDPVADGPTIQQAVVQAMEAGVRPRDVLALCGKLRERHPDTPLVVMTYANIAHRMGYQAFADALVEHGIDGAILADLPPEEADPVRAAFDEAVDLVFLAGPSTSEQRLGIILGATAGFLYLVGLFGVTGAREVLEQRTIDLVGRIAPVAHAQDVPVAIGFGVSTGEQARTLVEAGADGVVVGSAFVQKVLDGEPPAALGKLAQELSEGVRDGARDPSPE